MGNGSIFAHGGRHLVTTPQNKALGIANQLVSSVLRSRYALAAAAVLAVAILAIAWRSSRSQSSPFQTVAVRQGDLVAAISATGTVEPEEVIDVGAQVAGQIVAFGKDQHGKTIDYGSEVEEGTVLAQIDSSLYAADAAQARAALELAKAGAVRAEADVQQLQAKLYQARRDWERAQALGPSDALSQSDYDAAQAAHEVAKANVGVGRAAILQARNAVAQAEATLQRAEQNLRYCTIRSPVRGVIIDRRVNIGQTVVASLNAPSLFLLAKDLRRMQIWVPVNEADIGRIAPGQPVRFTVDTFPDSVFQGEVRKVRLNASMTQNVVTYTVEVSTDNRDGRLLPYLTANVKFIIGTCTGALLIPNAALRWSPRSELIASAYRTATLAGADEEQPARAAQGQSSIWVPQGAFVRPVPVQRGLTDGAFTEIRGDGIQENMLVVLGESLQDSGRPPQGTSPFAPQMWRRNRQPRQ